MLVSICTIARNEEGYLPHLLDDITKQDFPAGQIEVVMVDSGSKDGTRGIMENFAEKNSQFYNCTVTENPGDNQASGPQREISLSGWMPMVVFRQILYRKMWNAWKAEKMLPEDQDQIFRKRTHRGSDFF